VICACGIQRRHGGGRAHRPPRRRRDRIDDRAHSTAKGTAIAQKTWLLENRGEDRWRVSRWLNRD